MAAKKKDLLDEIVVTSTSGKENVSVRNAQQLLALHGFFTKPDGRLGPVTQRLLSEYQEAQSLDQTGVLDEATWRALLTR